MWGKLGRSVSKVFKAKGGAASESRRFVSNEFYLSPVRHEAIVVCSDVREKWGRPLHSREWAMCQDEIYYHGVFF